MNTLRTALCITFIGIAAHEYRTQKHIIKLEDQKKTIQRLFDCRDLGGELGRFREFGTTDKYFCGFENRDKPIYVTMDTAEALQEHINKSLEQMKKFSIKHQWNQYFRS